MLQELAVSLGTAVGTCSLLPPCLLPREKCIKNAQVLGGLFPDFLPALGTVRHTFLVAF